MSAATAAPQPAIQPDPQPSRSGRLLSLIRKLIDYGTALAATVRQRVAADPIFATTSFGTADLAVIFARIARGLQLAQALEARVFRRAASLDKGPRPRRARAAPGPRPPAAPPAEAADPRLAHLPTAEQIAARLATSLDPVVRRRPIGAVIADIYRDLGILPSHPLWREVQQAMREFGGSVARLLCDILDRAFPLKPPPPAAPAMQAAPPGPASAPPGTGPP
jgi:hypothetical protein